MAKTNEKKPPMQNDHAAVGGDDDNNKEGHGQEDSPDRLMKKWEDEYREKLVTPAKAVRKIESGNRVVLGHAAGEPKTLVDALLEDAGRLADVEVVHMVPLYSCEYTKPEYANHFRHNALFVGAGTREPINSGRADFTPCFFSEIPRLFREEILPVDAALVQVSPPDKHGYMSFGVAVDYTMQAALSARYTVAEVNKKTPRDRKSTRLNSSHYS